MLRRSTWIILGIFVLFVLGTYLWQRYGKVEDVADPTPTVQISKLLFGLGNLNIDRYDISNADGTSISLVRDPASNTWFVLGQAVDMADTTQIETVASNLAFLMVEKELPTQPELESMGLDNPSYTIRLIMSNGEQMVIYVGDQIPTGTGYYVRVENSPAVVVAKTELDTIINLLTNPPLTATYTPAVTMTATVTSTASRMVTSTPEVTAEPEMTTTLTP